MQGYAKERVIATAALLSATQLAVKMQGQLAPSDVVKKADTTPVTIADFGCQALINFTLTSTFPADPIMGEEDTLFLRASENAPFKARVIETIQALNPNFQESEILNAIDRGDSKGGPKGRFWVVDPIDGTKGFIENDAYANALALIEDGEVVLGMLALPRFNTKGVILMAVKGQGAHQLDLATNQLTPIHVSKEEPTTLSFHTPKTALPEKIARALGLKTDAFALDSMVNHGHLARGDLSLYIRVPKAPKTNEKIWDHAPGTLIVEEAGGRVTDLEGNSLNFSEGRTFSRYPGLIVSNGQLHDKVVALATT